MAYTSLVDFVRAGLPDQPPATNLDSASLARVVGAAVKEVMATQSGAQSTAMSERTYLAYAPKVIKTLEACPKGLTARALFDASGTENFLAFTQALDAMQSRGVIAVIGSDPKYADAVYGLVAPPASAA